MFILMFRRRAGLDPPLVFLLVLNVLTSAWWSVAQFNGGTAGLTHSSFAMTLIAFRQRGHHPAARIGLLGACRLRGEHRARRRHLALLAPGPYWSPQYNWGCVAAGDGASVGAIVALIPAWLRRADDVSDPETI